MADLIWAVLCAKHLVDPDSEGISLIDVTESLVVEGLEQQLEEAERLGKKGALINVPAQLASWWMRRPGEEVLQARLLVLTPTGETILEQTMEARWEDDNRFMRVYLNFSKLPVAGVGVYWFVVEQLKIAKGKEPRWIVMTRIPANISKA